MICMGISSHLLRLISNLASHFFCRSLMNQTPTIASCCLFFIPTFFLGPLIRFDLVSYAYYIAKK